MSFEKGEIDGDALDDQEFFGTSVGPPSYIHHLTISGIIGI